MTRVHSLVLKDADTGHIFSHADDRDDYSAIVLGLKKLQEADVLIGHNIIKFDIPALQKLYPWFDPKAKLRDTLVMSRLVWPKDDVRARDFKQWSAPEGQKKYDIPGKKIGTYGLEAWGIRLGLHKGDYAQQMKDKGLDPWAAWNKDMQDYCELDVEVTHELLRRIEAKGWSEESIELEHEVQQIIWRQESYGFLFDQEKAAKLYGKLVQKRSELETKLQETFKPWWKPTKTFTPKRDNKKLGYVAGVEITKTELVTFNPGSRDHIADRLQKLKGWRPVEMTDGGKPKIDETVLESLPYPEAKLLAEYFMVDKRIGQLAEGDEAWLKHVRADGRIHGTIQTNGAITGRMTHSKPNMSQVPASYSPYGPECRDLFCVPKRKKLVGVDADSLEGRCMAARMARYDEGAYIQALLHGKKEDGTDNHSKTRDILRQFVPGTDRDTAKTYFYAIIYGAGDEKLGWTLNVFGKKVVGKRGLYDPTAAKVGKESRKALLAGIPALGKLVKAVQDVAKARGHLKGLDGRLLTVRGLNSVLNTLLQSDGAILMKKALVIADRAFQARGWVPGVNYEFVANSHDEWQIEADEDIAEEIGRIAADAIRQAGEHYNYRCPLGGNYAIGDTWKDTH